MGEAEHLTIPFYTLELNKNALLYSNRYEWPPSYSPIENKVYLAPISTNYNTSMTLKRLHGIVPNDLDTSCFSVFHTVCSNEDKTTIVFNAKINLKTFHEHFKSHDYLWYRDKLFMILQKHVNNQLKSSLTPSLLLEPVIYQNPSTLCALPSIFLSKDIQLKEYQRENIRWMLNLEKMVDDGRTTMSVSNARVPITRSVFYDPMNNEILSDSSLHMKERVTNQVSFRGGGLLDEVGLGKTLCSLVLSAMNPCLSLLTDENDNNDSLGKSTLLNRMQVLQLSDERKEKLLQTYKTCHATVGKSQKICNAKTKKGNKYCGRHTKSWTQKDTEYAKNTTNPLLNSIQNHKKSFDEEIQNASSDLREVRRPAEWNPNYMLLNSKATLIICPNQISQQWENEVSKYMKLHGYKVLVISTKTSSEKYTVYDIMTADFVIVTHNYLVNPHFFRSAYNVSTKKTDPKSASDVIKHFEPTASTNKMMYKDVYSLSLRHWFNEVLDKKCLNLVSPPLHVFHWHRILVDEINEIAERARSDNLWSDILEKFSSKYRWCMSGTPFSSGESSIQYLVNFLTAQNSYVTENYWMYAPKVSSFIKDMVFRRNTKESVKRDYSKELIKEEIHWLKFTEIEKRMYQSFCEKNGTVVSKDSRYLRELCCSPFLSAETEQILGDCLTLEDAETRMGNHYKQEIKKTKLHIKNSTKRQTDLEEQIESIKEEIKNQIRRATNPAEVEMLKDKKKETLRPLNKEVGLLKSSISRSRTNLENCERASSYFNRVLQSIQKQESAEADTTNADTENSADSAKADNLDIPDECPVCLIELDNEVGLTVCGHVYCWECLVNIQKNQRRCCFCKADLTPNNIHKVNRVKKMDTTNDEDTEKDTEKTPEEIELSENIQKHGTKIANILHFIKNCDEKIILFSQWAKLLMSVEQKLKESGVAVSSCRGNVHQKNAAIREFTTEDSDVKVISISSESAPSGINLTAASVVIFIEPVYSDSMERINEIEEQGIGRAQRLGQTKPVRVVRFLMKDTVEEEIYNDRLRYASEVK